MHKVVFLVLSLFAVAAATAKATPFTEKDLATDESLRNLYDRWRGNNTIPRDPLEIERRFTVFKENVMYIHEANKRDRPYKLALNKFADTTREEFKRTYAGVKVIYRKVRQERLKKSYGLEAREIKGDAPRTLPASVDRRQKGALTAVKNQGQCSKQRQSFHQICFFNEF
jgi:KDEL-tailed cysteine endopeptidase